MSLNEASERNAQEHLKIYNVTREECNHCTIAKDKRGKTLPNAHMYDIVTLQPVVLPYNLPRQPYHRPDHRVRNPSTVRQIHSALHRASEASDRSARVRYLLLLAALSFRELITLGNTSVRYANPWGLELGAHMCSSSFFRCACCSASFFLRANSYFAQSQDCHWEREGVRSRYLLLLTLADSEVLGCLLTLGERVTGDSKGQLSLL